MVLMGWDGGLDSTTIPMTTLTTTATVKPKESGHPKEEKTQVESKTPKETNNSKEDEVPETRDVPVAVADGTPAISDANVPDQPVTDSAASSLHVISVVGLVFGTSIHFLALVL